jgi:hypothetical protein
MSNIIKNKQNKNKNKNENITCDDNTKTDSETIKTGTSLSGTIISIDDFTIWEKLHYDSILNFYNRCNIEDIKLMFQIINTNKPVSLRTIERYVTKYCDMEGTIINVNNKYIKEDRVNITICYNSFMDTYGKTLFDSCRRKRKFMFYSTQLDEKILTTIGQLIFFKCCFSYDLIKHTMKNIKNIEINKIKIDNFYKKKKYSKKNKLNGESDNIKNVKDVKEDKIDETKSNNSIYIKMESTI